MSMDIQISARRTEYELCPRELIQVQLSCHEDEFCVTNSYSGASRSDESEMIPGSGDLLALSIQGSSLRRDILRLSRQLALTTVTDSLGAMQPGQVELIVDEMRLALEQVAIRPDYSFTNLNAYARSRWLLRFVLGHL
ncbi:hypothetical protein CEP54_015170 [Fusarium duplospermum]|uniref:Uncharacterized protein n=1 Tax=Fusarium duplospermum TaxID=1325734 RepID=A0A428NQZ2_9HYPO|nr:hypothetical protein CEP54_015170 [Fusarium duplospermum]